MAYDEIDTLDKAKRFAKKAISELLIGRRKEINHYQAMIDDSQTQANINRVLLQVRRAI